MLPTREMILSKAMRGAKKCVKKERNWSLSSKKKSSSSHHDVEAKKTVVIILGLLNPLPFRFLLRFLLVPWCVVLKKVTYKLTWQLYRIYLVIVFFRNLQHVIVPMTYNYANRFFPMGLVIFRLFFDRWSSYKIIFGLVALRVQQQITTTYLFVMLWLEKPLSHGIFGAKKGFMLCAKIYVASGKTLLQFWHVI